MAARAVGVRGGGLIRGRGGRLPDAVLFGAAGLGAFAADGAACAQFRRRR